MGHGHTHGTTAFRDVGIARTPKRILLTVLIVVGVATIVGLLVLWPYGGGAGVAASGGMTANGTTFPTGEIVRITPDCSGPQTAPSSGSGSAGTTSSGSGGVPGAGAAATACAMAQVRLGSGSRAGETVTVMLNGPFAHAGLRQGDQLELMITPLAGRPRVAQPGGVDPGVSVFGVVRAVPLAVWAGLFVLVVAAVGLHRGLLALVGLVFSGGMIVMFMLPALLRAGPATAIALVGASAILYVVLYLAHGVSMRTSAALAGTLGGVVITAVVAQLAVVTTRLSGIDESAGFLAPMVPHVDFQGLLTCAIIIAGLGVLNDVTITQSSSVWELRTVAPGLSRRQLFGRAMRIGRDHIASTIYTIVFAYVGASLSIVLLLYVYDQPMLNVLSFEDIATEIIRTLCSGIGLVLAVPLTTAIAVALLPPGSATAGDPAPAALSEDDAAKVDWLRTPRDVELPRLGGDGTR
ncbi:YibE/F family protein [Microbacterium panaciterrae]|uniref:YibE/F family protein n=1 Tax=Microbacterium panaciterrae TaxID=985759 RepID=A0ABP8P479_9MICO